MITIEAFTKQAAQAVEAALREAAGGNIGIEEADRLARRARDIAAQLALEAAELADESAAAALAQGAPYFVAAGDGVRVKKGVCSIVLQLPLDRVPPELFPHEGRYHVRLTGNQLDWLREATR